jgi:hypothetical protein
MAQKKAQPLKRSPNSAVPSRRSALKIPFFGVLMLTFIVYILRGLGILSFLSGGILLILIGLSLMLGLFYGVDKTRRF